MSLKKSVLLLNASYEPIQLMSIEDAFINYFNGKVYIEEYQDKVYHSARDTHSVPSVIRLKEYKPINRRRRVSATKRTRIYIRDSFQCGYCGKKFKDKELTLDHIIPKSSKEHSKEFLNSSENLVSCCFKCNQKKRDFKLEDCGMKLIHPPKQLKVGLDKVVMSHWASARPSWKKYLFLSDEGDRSHRED